MSRFAHVFRATAAALTVGAAAAGAQTPDPPLLGTTPTAPVQPANPGELFRNGQGLVSPGPCPPTPCGPAAPGTAAPTAPMTAPPPATDPGAALGVTDAAGGPDLFAGADAGPTTGQGGYIDNAVPRTMFRLRYDSAYGNNRPDRAEFFYAKCGCFGTADARGPRLPETNIDYQQLYSYLEVALQPRLSLFANVPVRFLNPTVNANAAGLSDLTFGAKYAFIYDPITVMSLQVAVTVPTGDERLGLGSGTTWLEPGILYQRQMSERWQLFAQLKDSIFLQRKSDFTGNVLTYGVGSSYTVVSGCWGYVAPVGELVGWTVLSGKELNERGAVSASGDTIVNAKFGVRIGFGAPQLGRAYPTRSDFYIGYGRALTGEVWYKDMLRLEYRLAF